MRHHLKYKVILKFKKDKKDPNKKKWIMSKVFGTFTHISGNGKNLV